MYETFFGFTERPFTLRPDPTFLYLSSKHSIALSMLEYGLTGQTGFVVVTGDIGSGKTTIIRHFLKRVDQRTIVGVISNTHVAFGDVLQWIFQTLNIETEATDKAKRYQVLLNYLNKQYAAGYQVVLIVDEAQNLTIDALEELRLLSNINADREQVLQIILVGQPELLEHLKRPELRQFAQRISVHYHLLPLTYFESCAYIRHRLSVAGATLEIFDAMAMGAIYHFTNGVPRLINSVCDMALVYAYAKGEEIVDIDTVLAVARDREKGGVQALERTTAEMTQDSLIDRVRASFDQEKPQPVSDEEIHQPPPSGQLTINRNRLSVSDRDLSKKNGYIPVTWHGDIAGFSPNGERAPFIAASYLPDPDQHRISDRNQQKSGRLRWIRRLL
jgi:type II secretory pathway predicted ATPase ExeA